MIKVLLDNDISGFQTLLTGTIESAGWSEYELIEFIRLKDLGLDYTTNDREIWRRCQKSGYILLTTNRNEKGDDSLQLTIREENTPGSLPVITVSDQQKLHNSAYREECIERLLTIVLELNNHLGTGRLYIP
ncbi:MAG: ACP S-malonyltransferase [Acidobacteria bacterium]|nr:ACP S-malonyltransferase [Acidobacteriota bacterium]